VIVQQVVDAAMQGIRTSLLFPMTQTCLSCYFISILERTCPAVLRWKEPILTEQVEFC